MNMVQTNSFTCEYLNIDIIMKLTWQFKTFNDLSSEEMYALLKLRSEVFVVEQNCVFLDMDDKDQQSLHLMIRIEQELVAYCRIVPPGISFYEPSIGRVVSSSGHRRTGAGRALMLAAIDVARQQFDSQPIRIGAQLYLLKFYSSLGFEAEGDVYLEDGIEHIEMILN